MDKMSNDEKVHRLLAYAIEIDPDRFGWSVEDLRPAFNGALNEYELMFLCEKLIENGDAINLSTKDGFMIGLIDRSKSAFFGKKYLNEVHTHMKKHEVVQFNIGSINQVVGNNISDVVQAPENNSSEIKREQSKTSLLEKIVIYLVAPISVIIIAAIILKYFFGISP